jgi:hypothetical protein
MVLKMADQKASQLVELLVGMKADSSVPVLDAMMAVDWVCNLAEY